MVYKKGLIYVLSIFFVFFLFVTLSHAFTTSGCEGDCKKCHSLTNQELNAILKKLKLSHAKVINIQLSPVKSLWEIQIDNQGKKGIVYIDFSKNYLITGNIVEINTGVNKTAETVQKHPIGKTDISKIPLSSALAMGSPSASKKVVIVTDPD
ncbi:MAG: disulfide isomerase DsbC N-terminal domain-containing protein [Thermodesulfovibrionales bacterium]|nr:disulfide isomerase DsbC N-terminal domain-containing protein [Thermodesulfovibrionales bacterium]